MYRQSKHNRTALCPICGKEFSYYWSPSRIVRITCSNTCHGKRKANNVDEYRLDAETGCWMWQRYTDPKGYARMSVGGKRPLAHRVFYERANGPIPDGMEIDHTCNNSSCVNPEHMVPRTPSEHKQRHDFDYLSPDAIREIKALFPAETQAAIARRFNIDPSTVSRIVRGETWVDVA